MAPHDSQAELVKAITSTVEVPPGKSNRGRRQDIESKNVLIPSSGTEYNPMEGDCRYGALNLAELACFNDTGIETILP